MGDGCGLFGDALSLTQANPVTHQTYRIFSISGPVSLSNNDEFAPRLLNDHMTVYQLETGLWKSDINLMSTSSSEQWSQAGQLMWSPDDRLISLIAIYNPCGDKATSSLIVIDVQTGQAQTVINHDTRPFTSATWLGEKTVRLSYRYFKPNAESEFFTITVESAQP